MPSFTIDDATYDRIAAAQRPGEDKAATLRRLLDAADALAESAREAVVRGVAGDLMSRAVDWIGSSAGPERRHESR